MDYASAFEISAAGMRYEKARVQATALNLANMNVATPVGAQPFQPLRATASARPFAQVMDETRSQAQLQVPGEVRLEPVLTAPRLVHEPGHPQADERGFVAYPGVDHAAEMLNLVSATRAYEANVIAMNAAKTMALKSLDIGGNT